jgi:hypothetical protein
VDLAGQVVDREVPEAAEDRADRTGQIFRSSKSSIKTATVA